MFGIDLSTRIALRLVRCYNLLISQMTFFTEFIRLHQRETPARQSQACLIMSMALIQHWLSLINQSTK